MSEQQLVIQDVIINSEQERDKLMKDLDRFMGDYTDPPQQMREAVEAAKETGIIFEAVLDGCRVGLVVITETPFRLFQPRYHLAYIANDANVRGQGIGKKLLEESLRRTEGDLALHVSPKNSGAVKFYEHLGWKTTYCRMMPPK